MSDLFEILACELKKNNVSVEIHRVASPNLLAIGENIVGEKIILDFSKHDKVFEDKISELKAKIAIKDMDYKTASELLGKYQRENEVLKKRIQELRTRCTEGARDNFDKEIYGCLSIVSYPKEINNQNKELKKRISELESKETEKPTKINLNDRIKVKLTPLGAEIYYHMFDDTNKKAKKTIIEPHLPKVDEKGYTEFTLWGFINIYGQYIDVGKPDVIDPIDIIACE